MLKKMRLGGVMLASLLMATGCQNEEIVSNEQQKGNYSLTVSSLVDSRTYVEDNGTVKWSKGDQMYVYGKGVSGVLTLQGEGGDTKGTFTGYVFGNPDNLKWAVFGDNVKGTTDGAQFSISSVEGENSNSPMVGAINNGDVQMNHLCGMVRITINDLPESANVTLTGDNIAGTAEVKDGALQTPAYESKIAIKVAKDDPTIEIPVFATSYDAEKSFKLTVDGATYEFNAPIAIGKLSQNAIMELTCMTDESGKVTGFSQAATTAEAFKQAIESLKSGESISFSLNENITLDEKVEIPEGVTVILDLNGKTITSGFQTNSTTKHVYAIENRGTLTLKNGTVNSRGIGNYGTLIIEDGVYNAVDNNGGAAIWNYAGSNVEVNGGTFTAAQADTQPAASTMYVESGATAVVNGGTFKSEADKTYAIISYGDLTINNATVTGEHGAIAAEIGKLTINGGSYEITASGHVIYSTAATIELNGGSFKHSQIGASSEGNVVLYASNTAQATVNGGSYDSVEGAFAYSSMIGNITIKGGTFANKAATVYGNVALSEFVADGYVVVENIDDTWTVLPAVSGATLTNVADGVYQDSNNTKNYYVSNGEGLAYIAEMINDATDKKTNITLLADVDLTGVDYAPISGNKGDKWYTGTFDGQGHTIFGMTVNSYEAGLIGSSNGTVKNVIIDGATVNGDYHAAAIVGTGYGSIQNCTVKNSTITGNYAGALRGYSASGTNTGNFVENCVISGKYTAGGLFGLVTADGSNTISGNTVSGCTISCEQPEGNNFNGIGEVIGRSASTAVVLENNTVTNNTLK